MWGSFFAIAVLVHCVSGAARLVCYVDSPAHATVTECTHVVYAGNARGDKLDGVLKEIRRSSPKVKIVLRVGDDDKDYTNLLKHKHINGFEIHNAHRNLNRSAVLSTVESARSSLNNNGGGPLLLALPAHPELLAKYYDLRVLEKKVDLIMVQTHDLGKVKKMTYHPSRLSGLWDMMNTDSVVDLVVGLGVPSSKIVISLPASAQQFTLQNETLSTPGSPALEDEPKEIGQAELCRQLQKGRWTLERDQDLSAPYAFKNTTWIAFEDSSSVDVKGKYARVRGLAGLALHQVEKDEETPCGPTLRTALAKVLNQRSRAPRGAILRSLEQEILSAPGHGRALDALQVSPYRITQVVDSDGVIHSIREDTRTEFSCSRQGYFVHPRSCARFYRCVKFDQLSPEYTVFEFDCPAGLAFDSRYEVCVWPGSLPDTQACPGSSEIAPVPKTRFICPEHEGYYADPENCRWFFACLDHGKAPLTAYEFRCPFGLGFDAEKLKCEWPWLVPACGNIARYEAEVHGYSGALLSGAAGFQGKTADSVNIAAHQSLVSGASLDNLVGIQTGFLTNADSLDSNFIASQELANAAELDHNSGSNQAYLQYQDSSLGLSGQAAGLVQPTKYNDEPKYTSGSIILDDYRLPSKKTGSHSAQVVGLSQDSASNAGYTGSYSTANLGETDAYNKYSTSSISKGTGYQSRDYDADNSGAYVHDPSGDYAEPYRHLDSPSQPYLHQDSGYKSSSDYYDYGRYKGTSDSGYSSQYSEGISGQYVHDKSGDYVENGKGYKESSNGYKADYSGSNTGDLYTQDNTGQYVAGVYRTDGHIGAGGATNSINVQSYSQANAGKYISNSKAYTGSSHTLTAGAVNVGLVGKTTLVDADYNNQFNYKGSEGYTQGVSHQTLHPSHVVVSQPVVSIKHVGTDENNLDGYGYVTTPTSSGVPTTATPFAYTTALPAVTTYKTTFVPEPPRSTVKQIFGFSQPQITAVQPTVVAVRQYVTPKIEISNYNRGLNYKYESNDYLSAKSQSQLNNVKESNGYDYSQPSVKFEDGISYTTAAPAVVSTYKPEGFSHSQQTHHNVESVGYQYSTPVPVTEPPFKKLVAYTTGPSVTTFAQPAVASYPQAYSHQTLHKVEANNVQIPAVAHGASYNSEIAYEEPKIVQYTTARPAVTVQPVVSTYQPQVFSQQTLHKVDASRINTYSQDTSSGYKYEKPAVKFEENVKTVQYVTPEPAVVQYSTPTVVQYSTPAPAVVSTHRPQAYSHQVLHKFESKPLVTVSSTPLPIQYEVKPTPVTVYQNPILKYIEPKVTPVTYVQPAYNSQAYSHQTIHKFETPSVETGRYDYSKSTVSHEQPKSTVYSTSRPAIAVSTYQPQAVSHQTYHKVDAGQVKTYTEDGSGYHYTNPEVKFEIPQVQTYSTPAPVVSTYKPQVVSYQTYHKVDAGQEKTYTEDGSGYHYTNPEVKFEVQQVQTYSTPAPVVSTYKPQVVSHQTYHKVDAGQVNTYSEDESGYHYTNPEVKFEVQQVQTYSTPAPVVSTYKPQVVSHQTYHKVDAGQVNTYSEDESGYHYSNPEVEFEVPQVQTYSTPAPVVSTYKPQVVSHQTYHKVDAGQVNTYSEDESGYHYTNPEVKFEVPQVQTYSTPAPVVSTYKPQTYSHQTVHNLKTQNFLPSTTVQPQVDYSYQTAAVSKYENPILTYTKKVTPVTYVKSTPAVFTQTYQPVVQQHEIRHEQADYSDAAQQSYEQNVQLNHGYTYEQPEIQSHVDTSGKSYSDATVVSHQTFHLENTANNAQSEYNSGKDFVVVSSTPANLAYEEHYSEYEEPKKVEYKAPEYIPPKTEYQQTYSVSSTAAPAYQQTVVSQGQYDVKPLEYSQQYDTIHNTAPHISFSTSHATQPRVESVHLSTYPGAKVTTKYNKQTTYDNPEIQVEYKAEEYLPPVVSTVAPVTTTYRPRTYSTTSRQYLPPTTTRKYLPPTTTREYLPPAEPEYDTREYLPPVDNTYLPPSSTARPIVKSRPKYKATEYLPPTEQSKVVNYESFGYKNFEATAEPEIRYNPYQEVTVKPIQRKPNIVVETAKNLLGFGTVGPDAGLVSPVTYTTAAPVVISSTTYRPIVKSTTQEPTYKYVESTTAYKAPEYLPPSEETKLDAGDYGSRSTERVNNYNQYRGKVSTNASVQRKQNIVVQTAKANQLGFGTVGSDAGLVSYSSSTPVVVSSTESYSTPQIVTSTYAPVEQGHYEVPRRRTKSKVAVVTKINDFNPLLVRKLGAVCSCQSPVLVLKGSKANTPTPKDFNDYGNDYEDSGRGDISDYEWTQKTAKSAGITATPRVTSTSDPIIVPEDSYYQDYQEPSYNVAVTPKNQEVYVSSTPVVSSTERVVRIKPRVKAVTVAPTYKTILLKQEVAPTAASNDAEDSAVDSQSFDRYGPGGLRSRDETLQGSVDCKRAGLFRHPKQCNKFYACRWDCTKQRFTLHVFNCPVQLSFDPNIGACNWPSQGPACQGDTLLTNTL